MNSAIFGLKEQCKIYNQLRQKGVTWHFNPPLASHAGRVWEQIIRSIRRILTALTTEQTLDDKTLSTLLAEVERILNDRPLIRGERQVDDLDPLTPSKLLLEIQLVFSAWRVRERGSFWQTMDASTSVSEFILEALDQQVLAHVAITAEKVEESKKCLSKRFSVIGR